jgi:hypothetical protein
MNKNLFRYMKKLIALLAILIPVSIHAHPGQGSGNGMDLAHHLTSPLHLMTLLCVVSIVVYWYKKTHQTSDQ